MRMSEELYRIGREASLSPEDRNHVLNCAAEIDLLRFQLREADDLLKAAWRREEKWNRMLKEAIGLIPKETDDGTDR